MSPGTLAAIGRLWASLTWDDATELTLEHFTRETCATWIADNHEELTDAMGVDVAARIDAMPPADREAALAAIVDAAVVEFVEGDLCADEAREQLHSTDTDEG